MCFVLTRESVRVRRSSRSRQSTPVLNEYISRGSIRQHTHKHQSRSDRFADVVVTDTGAAVVAAMWRCASTLFDFATPHARKTLCKEHARVGALCVDFTKFCGS